MKYDVNVLVGIFHHQIGYESNLYTQIDVKRPTASPLQIKQEEDLNPDLRFSGRTSSNSQQPVRAPARLVVPLKFKTPTAQPLQTSHTLL